MKETGSVKEYPFLGLLYVISREKFWWEMGVFVISDTQDTHFVEPWLHRLFFKSILPKDKKKNSFLFRINQSQMNFFGNALTPLNSKGSPLKAVFDN